MSDTNTTAKGKTAAFDAASKIQEVHSDAVNAAKETFNKLAQTNFKAVDDATAFGKANLDAWFKASQSFARGFEELTRGVVEYGQGSIDTSVKATKALLGAKSVREVADLQNDFAKQNFDRFVAETTRLGELSVRVANETLEPINGRFAAVIETVGKPSFATI